MSCPSDGYIDGSGMWKSSFLYSWHTSFLTTPLPCRTTASFSCAGSLGPLRVGRGYICLLSKFYCGSFAFWIVGHVPVRYFTHLVYVSGHNFVYSHVAVSGSCRLLEFYTNRGWLASSTLKGCTFLPCALILMYKKILISKQILVLSLLIFIQKDHVVIAVKDALSRYTPPVPEEYYKVLHTCNTFICSQLITILQCIQCVLYYSKITFILHMYSILYWLYYNTVDVFCHCCQF